MQKTMALAALLCAIALPAAALKPSQVKAQYLNYSFKAADGKAIHFAVPKLQYQNPHYNMLNAGPLKDTMLQLANAELAGPNKEKLAKLLKPYVLKRNDPIFMYVFNGEGSPLEVVTVLKLATVFKAKLNKGGRTPWDASASEHAAVKKFLYENIGINCNGFAGSYAHLAGASQTPRTSIIDYARPARRIKKVSDIHTGDVMVWKNGKHITVIEQPLGDGKFKVVESAAENEVRGLTNTVWEIQETGGDVLKGIPVTPGQPQRKAAYGAGREMYVAKLK